jgi:hypothetical protein
MKEEGIHIKCISIPPSPLLGGTILATVETLINSRSVELCMHIDNEETLRTLQFSRVIEMLSSISGVVGIKVTYKIGREREREYSLKRVSVQVMITLNSNV